MKAGAVTPGQRYSARLIEMALPSVELGEVRVRVREVGIDGTDIEISGGRYGESPSGQDFLILGHEALGEIEDSGNAKFKKGELVVPIVRRPDSCINCLNGQYDMCLEGNYKECGIKGLHGFAREHISENPKFLVMVPASLRSIAVLTEPMSIVTKGIDQAIEFHHRYSNPVQVALVLGAGSLGLLATAFLRVQNFNTYTLDIVPKSSLKGQLVEALGATYLNGASLSIPELPEQIGNLDIIVEATGNSTVAFQAMTAPGRNGILCLMGVSTGNKPLEICADCLDMEMVLGNKVVFGTVSSNRSHFERAVELLASIERNWPQWLSKLITRRLRIDEFTDALHPTPDNIKTVIQLL